MLKQLSRFGRKTDGVAAVEFALLAPMMIFLLFGLVDLVDAFQTNRRVEIATVSLADVVSRDTEVDNSEVNGLWAALNVLMAPDPAVTMDARITSVQIESASTARVVWSEGRNGFAPLAAGSTVSLPAGLMTPGTSIIMAESRYSYHSPTDWIFPGGTPIQHTAYRRSRLVDPIPRV